MLQKKLKKNHKTKKMSVNVSNTCDIMVVGKADKVIKTLRRGVQKIPPTLEKCRGGKQMLRPDKKGPHRVAYEKNKRKVIATQDLCGICGKRVDKSLRYPDPMSPCIDHVIPVAKGGHPSDLSNLQLAHLACNNAKSDKLYQQRPEPKTIGNRNLPQSRDWSKYKS